MGDFHKGCYLFKKTESLGIWKINECLNVCSQNDIETLNAENDCLGLNSVNINSFRARSSDYNIEDLTDYFDANLS